MKICITHATTKHAIALAHYLKQDQEDHELIGISSYCPKFQRLFRKQYHRMVVGDLSAIVAREKPDLVIPVGSEAVFEASQCGIKEVVLPDSASVLLALDKSLTTRLAQKLAIPTPKTSDYELDQLHQLKLSYPVVVKGRLEGGSKRIDYPNNPKELEQAIQRHLSDPAQKGHLPLIQEYIPGTSLGFFGFYQKGELKRFYMHERVRQLPITGGPSTAAKTVFHDQAFVYGKRILDHLSWHGVAMVEFKFQPTTGRPALLEINPKFWGSTELGLAAGINFGSLLVKTQRGEPISADLSPTSYPSLHFHWPFDGDLISILQSRDWPALKEYWRGLYQTNVRTNGILLNMSRLSLDIYKYFIKGIL